MATPYSGKGGSLTVFNNGADIGSEMYITNWSVSVTDSAPATAHSGSQGWVVAFLGMKAWSGTIDVLMDSAVLTYIPKVGDPVSDITLTDGENSYDSDSGGVITNAAYSCDIAGGGLVTLSLSISGDGELEITA